MRVLADDETHVGNVEFNTDFENRTETDYNCGSIPDEIDSLHESLKEAGYRTVDNRQLTQEQERLSIKHSNTLELSKKGDSIDMNSIFYSESPSNGSSIKAKDDEKNYVELCRELNDMASELIKQGIRLQEGEDEGEGEGEEDEEDRLQRALECFEKAKAYLNACLNHASQRRDNFKE